MITKFDGRYSFLSNFYPCIIEHNSIVYKSVESYYVAMKVKTDQQVDGRYISYIDCRELISKIESPAQVKNFGKKLSLRKDWEEVKYHIMLWGVREKFKNDDLRDLLLSTGDEELIEGNSWHDNFFGVCKCGSCYGKGQNNLGKILMKVREELRGVQKAGLEDILK